MADPQELRSTPLSSQLPSPTTYLTGYDEAGKSILESTRPNQWKPFENNEMAFSQVYTTSFPADLNANKDIAFHDEVMASGTLGLVKKDGVVCRMVDFAPGYTCLFHRTSSLDFGIVTEGTVEMILDDGHTTLMKRGDVAVQRATMHKWRNPSTTEWTRMVFILQDIKPLKVAGQKVGESLGEREVEGLLPSGNDTD